jgi:hypothetical protein
MQNLIMSLRIFIIILLLWAGIPAFADAARLTLGVAPVATRAAGLEDQARELAARLTTALGDEVSVRSFDNPTQLDQWLSLFTMIDLGLVDAAFLTAHPGKFLVLGPADQTGQLFVVARQGAAGDFPQRVAAALSRDAGTQAPAPIKSAGATGSPPAVAKRSPPETVAAAAPLVLGLVVTREGVLRSPAQAKQFAAHLGKWLGAPVRIRLFDSEPALVEWFCRLRMIDLALIDEPGRHDPLIGNYHPLRRLVAAGGGAGLLVARQDLPKTRLEEVLRELAAHSKDPSLDKILTASTVKPSGKGAVPAVKPAAMAVRAMAPSAVAATPAPPRLPEAPMMPSAPARPASAQSVSGEPPAAVAVVEMGTETVAAVPETTTAAPSTRATSPPRIAQASEVPAVIAQPDLPQELRPPGVPQPRPGRLPEAAPPAEEPTILGRLQDLFGRTPKPPPLLPPPDPEPGVVYVVPFITLMVPAEVRERTFDQFVDLLNQRGSERGLKFVILKQGLDKIDRTWLSERKYVLGEIYGYVEDSGCCSTDLRTRARLTFYRAHLPDPALKYEYPVRKFFDHDLSTLTLERQKLADQISRVLAEELLKALQP